ncbi:hypothetical protein AAZV13_06G124000 [Glycine max]
MKRVFFGSSVFAALTFWTFLRTTSQFDDDDEPIKEIIYKKNGPKISLISTTAHFTCHPSYISCNASPRIHGKFQIQQKVGMPRI